jgi:CubicO group peptidase (beta-lactamase class C family)
MQRYAVPGLAVGVMRNGQLSIVKSFGYQDVQSQKPLGSNTVFRAASFGKPVFAYIVLALVQQGRLALDRPLISYTNERVLEDDSRSDTITARMVLSHTTGLPNLNVKPDNVRFYFDPGTRFKYSGYAYLYLQKVVEKVTARSLEELAEQILFRPLNMTHSSYVWRAEYDTTISTSYGEDGVAFNTKSTPDTAHSAWSLFTTLEDFTKFVSHIIHTYDQPNSVSSALLTSTVDVAKGVRWGLGWGLQDTAPNPSFWHWGSTDGFRHFILGYPKERVAVIVMANGMYAFSMVDDVMASAIGGSYPAYDWF